MQLVRQMIYNASIITLFQELYKKYPHPIVIYDNYANESFDIYQTVTVLNSQWISKSLEYVRSSDQYLNEINSLHVFCVENVLDSVQQIRDNILRTSNSYRIQNIILFNEQEPPHSVNIFAENERIHRNTMLCQRHTQTISCWYWTEQVDRKKANLLDLLYEPINLNLLEIQISAHTSPPNAFVSSLSDRCVFVGLNAMIVAEILSQFNATPRYCNRKLVNYLKEGLCSKVDRMNGDDALKLLRQRKIDRKVRFRFLQMVFDKRMIKYLFLEHGVCKGPPDINMDIAALNEKNHMRALVPTELSCITVIIPRADAATSFLRRMFYSVESIAFFCTVLLFTTGRIIISKSPLTEWFDIFYSTFVVYLNQTRLKQPKTEAERILYGFLLALSVTTTVMLSGLIFTNMVNNPSSKLIQTVNDLATSNYKIFALDNAGNWMENLRDDIRVKVTVVHHFIIRDQLVARNKTVALAINENLLGLVKSAWDSPNLESKLRNDFYQMREKLHCGYFAYRISMDLALENDINQILQQMIEHGFVSAFKKWSMHLLKLMDMFSILSMEASAPINFSSSHGIFYLYLCGISLSFVVFLCERLYKRIQG